MDFGSSWRIGTSFGWVHLRLRDNQSRRFGLAQPGTPEQARTALLLELAHSPEAQRALSELQRLVLANPSFVGFGFEDDAVSSERAAALRRFLEAELAAGRVELAFDPFVGVFHEHEHELPSLPPLGPAAADVPETSFIALRLIDQNGAPVMGRRFKIELPDGKVHRGTTDTEGFGRVAGFTEDGNAKISFAGLDELDLLTKNASTRVVIPVNEEGEDEDPVTEAEQAAADEESPPSEEEGQRLGLLFVELFDKTGRVRHADRAFRVSGPESFEGRTDSEGRVRRAGLKRGNYTLSLTLDFFTGDPDATVDTVDVTVVLLDEAATEPQVRMVGAVPRSILARLDMFFNTNKTFLLPTALPSVRQLRQLYLDNRRGKLLVVGHADTAGGAAYNDKLSLERAEATIAYLKDDVEGWLKFYQEKDEKKRWGKTEDHLMLIAMPDYVDKPIGEDEVRFFQRTRGLKVDGIAGDETRRALIKEYMALDGASLSELVGEIEAVAHGCGENFPLDESGDSLDSAPEDQRRDATDRRVELFFFDPEFGITPQPPSSSSAPGSVEYPLWRQRVAEVVELKAGELAGPKVVFVELADAHFRSDSAVVLPEGERPSSSQEHAAFTSIGLIAAALRFNEEHPGRSLVVAGHTDTTAGDEHNQELSELRAKVALALLKGDREAFKTLCHSRRKYADIKQILSWVSGAFEDLPFDCKPAAINDAEDRPSVSKFQTSFNTHREQLQSPAPPLLVDGGAGELTWGAFFDCYEHALRLELGEDAAGLAALRAKLKFTDPERESLGFGEHFPIEELGVDEFRSQTNRRVEIVFFEPGEEPDLARAEADPSTSELYLPGHFARTSLPGMVSAKPLKAEWVGPAPAKFGETRTMRVSAPGVSDGLPGTFIVEQVVAGVPRVTATVTAAAAGEEITATFNGFFNEDLVVFAGSMSAEQPFPAVSFRFVLEAGGRRVTSPELLYADELRMLVEVEAGGPPAAQAEFRLHSPWGIRPGKTDDEGKIFVDQLPPGGAHVVVSERLVASSVPTLTGGDPPVEPPQQPLELTLVDAAFEPRNDVEYTIIVDEFTFYEGRTGPDGRISESINADAKSVLLQFDEAEVALEVSGLPPASDLRGVQRRLNNLGYDSGGLTDALNPAIEAALKRFRRDRGLAPPAAGASALDDATRSELVRAHGS